MRHVAILAAALLAGPAIAQTPSEALARLMMDACIFDTATPAIDESMLEAAGFEGTGHGDGTAEFAAPSGATLSYAAREGFASCEMRLPGIGEEGFEPLATALSAAIAERVEAAPEEPPVGGEGAVAPSGLVAGQDEDGFEWEFAARDGAVTRALLALAEDGAATLTAATEVAR